MPVLPVGFQNSRQVVISAIDILGAPTTMSLEGIASSVTEAQLNDWVTSMMSASNAGQWRDSKSLVREAAKSAATALDESLSSVSDVAVFEFETPTLLKREVVLRAPAFALFQSDGVTIDPENSFAADIIADTLTLINAGGGAYAFVRGYRRIQGRKTRLPNILPTPVEPEIEP